ncbi:MAG TPA: acyltransferase [Methylomirabilota bacterium]|nr:acyltransferase [Methylomirabilota bacterium]
MSTDSTPFRLTRVAALDGLRGVAILTVMLFHALLYRGPRPNADFLGSGGFLGVDLFFVLSGFLITALLMQEWQRAGDVALGAFYARRALRLLPALFALIATMLLVPGVFYESARPWRDAGLAALHTTNWVMAFGGNLGLFDHTWSLTIEEQFYLLWPPLLVLLLGLRVRRAVILAVVGIGILTPTWLRFDLWHGEPSANRLYYGLDTRFDGLLIGCLVALLASWDLIPRSRRALATIRVAAAVSAIVLAICVATMSEGSRLTYQGLGTLATVATACLVLHVLYCPTRLSRLLLENRPLVWVGRISYGLYLWHFPIFRGMLNPTRMGKLGITGPALFTVRFAVAFLVAALSFWLLERPFLRMKRRFERRRAPAADVASIVGRDQPVEAAAAASRQVPA